MSAGLHGGSGSEGWGDVEHPWLTLQPHPATRLLRSLSSSRHLTSPTRASHLPHSFVPLCCLALCECGGSG